jgi:alpha-mannosidase
MVIGKYSGSERLDPKQFEEPEIDNAQTKEMWLDEIANDEDFIEEMKAQIERIKNQIRITADPDKLRIHMTGQSHIDIAWRWRYEQTRKKGLVTFRKAILHGKLFPNRFNYSASEPLLFEWCRDDDPALFEEVKEFVKNGAISLVGGSWVEPDCMMPSGEAMCRQRLYGQRFFKDYFGHIAKTEWMLDSFGYNAGFPQILVKSGAEYFWTSKITWNRQTVFPFVNFYWRSPDGSQILSSNFQQNFAPLDNWIRFEIGRHPLKSDGQKVWNYSYDYYKIEDHIEEDEVVPPVGVFFGKGDGGHGPTHEEVAKANAFENLGFTKWSTADKFFEDLEQYKDKLPVWDDELYLEYHRGTFSVHPEVKRHNRLFENLLVSSEVIASILGLSNPDYKYPFELLEKAWKILLQNQFHDCLPGSSIPEVYDDLYDMWQETKEIISKVHLNISESFSVPAESNLILINQLNWDRVDRVFIPVDQVDFEVKYDEKGYPQYAEIELVNGSGKKFIAQPICAENQNNGEPLPAGWWAVVELKALSATPVKIYPKEFSGDKIAVSKSDISNGLTKVKLDDKTGAILSIETVGVNDGKNIIKGTRSNQNVCYVDNHPVEHAWNIKLEYWDHPIQIDNAHNLAISVLHSGPVFSTIEIKRTLGDGPVVEMTEANKPMGENPVTQRITLFKKRNDVYCEWETDWKQPYVMTKVAYDFNTNAKYCTSDQMYCAIQRSTEPVSPPDKARYEKFGHKYFDVSTPNNEWGVALLNNGKYAYDTLEKDALKLTMLRSATYPTPAGEAWVIEERKVREQNTGTKISDFISLWPYICRYALLPHKNGALVDSEGKPSLFVKHAAEEFNNPVIVLQGKNKGGSNELTMGNPLISTATPNVYVTSFKRKEWEQSKNYIVRIVEQCGIPSHAEINFDKNLLKQIKNVKPTDILERPITDFKYTWDSANGKLVFEIGKFEICTFEIVIE